MKCPVCGGEDFVYTTTNGLIIRKKLPIWIAIVMAFVGIIINLICAPYGALGFFSAFIYLGIRYERIKNDKKKLVTKKICKNCNHFEIIL